MAETEPKPKTVSSDWAGQTLEGTHVGDEHTSDNIAAQYSDTSDVSIQALTQVADAEAEGQDEFMPKKTVADLSQGFRLTPTHGIAGIKESGAHVVTRFGDDVFAVELTSRSLDGTSVVLEGSVRRKRDIPWPQKGSASLEVWKVHQSTTTPRSTDYHIEQDNGGALEEQEFWRRYNASVVDPAATSEYSATLAERQRRYQTVILTWIQEEAPQAPIPQE
jgi:hypothetical protein